MREGPHGNGVDAAMREIFEEIAWLEIARRIRRMIACPEMEEGLPPGAFSAEEMEPEGEALP